ncbi:MAG: RNA polymerase sigma factor [Microthrixaceae bacterium]
MNMDAAREEQFRAAYANHSRALLAFAARRCNSLPDAADVVAETMLVAWRRIARVPPEPETRLWLFAVARNVISNQRRGHRRRVRLGERLREQLHEQSHELDIVDDDVTRAVHAALRRLKPIEREVMLLTVGEQLTPTEIAAVVQLNASTVRTHLQRARTKLRSNLADGDSDANGILRRDRDGGHEQVEAQMMPRSHGPEEVSG